MRTIETVKIAPLAYCDQVVEALRTFYDEAILMHCHQFSWCDGWVIYLNVDELEWTSALDLAVADGRGLLALRPFNSRRAVLREMQVGTKNPAGACIQIPLLHPVVTSVVLSPSNPGQATVAYASDTVAPNVRVFDSISTVARQC